MPAYQRAKQGSETQKLSKANKPESQNCKRINSQQMLEAPETLQPQDVLAAQQQLGNQVVQRALDEGEKRKPVTDQQGNLRDDISSSIHQSRGSGSTLTKELQVEMSQRLGRDFQDVRLHTDGNADKLSRTINARAFTIGTDIYFKNGVYAPGTQKGRETLIHELTHVVQQSRSGKTSTGKLKLGAPNTAMEKEADHKGKQDSQLTAASAGAVQRAEEEEEILQKQPAEEEEMLQMQPSEEEALQMQPAEEEETLQMQPQEEEETLQMQPDSGGVIQRFPSLDEIKKKLSRKKPDQAPAIPVTKPSANQISGFARVVKPQSGIEAIEKQRQEKFKRLVSQPGATTGLSKSAQKVKLVQTLKNPNASEEDRQKAEERLRTFHKAGKFKRNPASIALKERKKMLKQKAALGDEKAADLYKKENPGFLSKVENFAGKASSFYGKHEKTIGKISSFLGFGGSSKDKDKDDSKGSSGGGGGDGGGYAVIISQLLQENKMLKEKLGEKGA